MRFSRLPQAEDVLSRLLRGLACTLNETPLVVSIHRSLGPRNPVVTPFGLVVSQAYSDLLRSFFAAPEIPVNALATSAHATAHHEFSPFFNDVGHLGDLSLAVISILEDARVEACLCQSIPNLSGVFGHFLDPMKARDLVGVEGQLAQLAVCLHRKSDPFDNFLCAKALSMMEGVWDASSRSPAERRQVFDSVRAIGSVIANDLGQLRYRFDRSSYSAWPPYRDDNSVLWSDERAQDFLHETVTRTGEPFLSSVGSEESSDQDGHVFYYDEWDFVANQYKEAYATVRHHGPGLVGRKVDCRQRFLVRSNKPSTWSMAIRGDRRKFSNVGNEINLDLVIERTVDLISGKALDDCVFQFWQRQRLRVGVMLLLDASESANERIPGTFLSVLDAQKQALSALADRFRADSLVFAVASFRSNTQDDVRVTVHKEFSGSWSMRERESLRNLQAQLSTRMGAALRHAGNIVEEMQQSIVVVITDGEPSDVDERPVGYFDHDARVAVNELKRSGVDVLCLKIGDDSDERSARIFGSSHVYCIRPQSIAPGLFQLFKRLRKNFSH